MSYHILCIDEMELVGIELGSILKEIDVHTVSTRNEAGAEVALQSGKYKYDAVVWALNYVESKSFEDIRALKKKVFCKELPLVIVSKYTDKKHIIKAIEAGAIEYIAKPYDRETVLNKIGRILGKPAAGKDKNFMEDDLVTYSLNEMMSKELKSSSRGDYPISIMMASIVPQTFNTNLNEDPGVLAGLMVRILKTKLRDTDTAFIYGPNSFIILLPFADRQGAEIVGMKVDGVFREHTMIKHRNNGCSLFTAFATCPDHGRVKEKLIQILEKEISERVRFTGMQAAGHI